MIQHIGDEFEGIIAVANFGMFIELPNTIEGMVHIAYETIIIILMNDKWH